MKNTGVQAAVALAMAVMLGAFAAHGLKNKIPDELLHTFRTGVDYHFYHALGLLIIAFGNNQLEKKTALWAKRALWAGIFLFSGSLYVLAISGIKWLGIITPFGGIAFIIGWVLLAISFYKNK